MENQKKIILNILSVVVLSSCTLFTNRTAQQQQSATDAVNELADTSSEDIGDAQARGESENNLDNVDTTGTGGTYGELNATTLAKAQQSGNDTVLFFHADWCPTCRAADTNIRENFANIPSNLTILKANYDDESDLKVKYGVVSQHTFVQIDSNGDLVKKWSGGSLADVVEQVN